MKKTDYVFNNTNFKIHLKSKRGSYYVYSIGKYNMTCQTENYTFRVPISDFKCFSNQLGYRPTPKQANYFRYLLNENTLKEQLEDIHETLLNEKIYALEKIKEKEADLKYEVDNYYDNLEDHVKILQKKLVLQEEEYEEQLREALEEQKDSLSENIMFSQPVRDYKLDKAAEVYQYPIDLSTYQNTTGIKFIIQSNVDDPKEHRLFFDPFRFGAGYHETISRIADKVFVKKHNKGGGKRWATENGGWLRVIDDVVVLYSRSGDYGPYINSVGIECAKKIFPSKTIYSFASFGWEDDMLTGNPARLETMDGYVLHPEFKEFLDENKGLQLPKKDVDTLDLEPVLMYFVYKEQLSEEQNRFIADNNHLGHFSLNGACVEIHEHRHHYLIEIFNINI